MAEIKKIIIGCYRKDFYLTRICVASIRYFYPDIEIFLLKDFKAGNFSTRELEVHWQVKVLPLDRKKFGWGFIKLEPLFFEEKEKVLILDSDIIFIGDVLNKLENSQCDFIVSGEKPKSVHTQSVKDIYYDYEKLLRYDTHFEFPEFLFNTGNYVAQTGILHRHEFNDLVAWNGLPKLVHPTIFSCAEQGILNYLLVKKWQENAITLANIEFMYWGKDYVINGLDFNKIIDKSNTYPYLIHWAGTRHFLVRKMCRNDLLTYFENYYYTKIPRGKLKQALRNAEREFLWPILSTLKKVKKTALQASTLLKIRSIEGPK